MFEVNKEKQAAVDVYKNLDSMNRPEKVEGESALLHQSSSDFIK